ncbi:uncharacterized protein LOC131248268 isoform X2 [Magnolia sinica]|uniref:uncharacterized protein LOC131248268 isoform X2 n=1 Tax=Magnolia sinica TaxID=86752 RepID=UPI00265B2592|nr:uncharacterized protein LOC131248268 isoform X2 [Magnolia sinica]
MLPFSSTVSDQIRFLLQNSDDSNSDSVFRELCQFVEYGNEGSIVLLQACLDQVKFQSEDFQSKLYLLSAIFRYFLGRPNFATVFCEALRSKVMSEGFLEGLSKQLHLSTPEKIAVGLALSDSGNMDFRIRGQNFCRAHIEELCTKPASVSHEQIQNIFLFLSQSEGLSKHVDSFTKMLSLLQLKERTHFVLAPILADDSSDVNSLRYLESFFDCTENDFDTVLAEIEKEISMADIMKELGYGCTTNTSVCKEMLSLFSPLNEVTLSRILCTMAWTHIGLEDSQNTFSTFCSALGTNSTADSSWLSSWNVDVLVDSIKELAPEIDWRSVMENLDHEGFYFPDEKAFSLFMSIYAKACQDPFPLHAICGSVWKNAEGQLSFLRHAVFAPPELFTFTHSTKQLSHVDAVHGSTLPPEHANNAWFCLELLEVLCQLAESGYASSVRTMLEYPLKQCPDVLPIGMAQINTAFNLLQHEVCSIVFPVIAGSAMKSGIVHHLWLINPKLVLRGFVEIHNTNPDTIEKILDICQELKILSSVLDMTPFPFSIKLAVLASQKEHVNLEKWLHQNLSTYKDSFFEYCLNSLKEIPLDGDASASPFQHFGAVLNVLQAHSGQLVSCQLSEEMERLLLASGHVNPRLQGGGVIDSLPSDGYPGDVEAETDSYFHQIYSKQLTVDQMIKMIARFKDSPEKREQSIYHCMIANLFKEYLFFHSQPESQFEVTAVLLGSLINHQLLHCHTLGVAIHCVLNALREPVDSKMFVFGAKALEQFLDRLVEWPKYCNEILQIPHLRGAQAELFSYIERVLTHISLGQLESNGGNGAPTDQHKGFSRAPSENLEALEPSGIFNGSGTTKPGQQLSPCQLQQRRLGFVDGWDKASAAYVSHMELPLSFAGQPLFGSSNVDLISNQKPLQIVPSQHPPSRPATVIPSLGFLHHSQGITSVGLLRQNTHNMGFGAALNIETLLAAAERRDTPLEVPAVEVQEKISFMVNNISSANIDSKAKEFIGILEEQHYPWFAQYMVMKRASIEPNFHDLYLEFIDKVNSRLLNKEIMNASYENCKVLLRSELIKSSSEERSLFRNLGSWLGKFTIGRNQVLLAREIDLKALIIKAYEKGLMIAVIPFTSKILGQCQSSLAYQPPNSWTMAILSLLAEIYALPNLKMNLKFDIEVLFRNLCVDMKDVKPSSLLKDRVREIEGNPDFSKKDTGASQPPMVAEANSGMVSSLSQVEVQAEHTNPSHSCGHYNGLSQSTPSRSPLFATQHLTPIPNIGIHVVVNQKLGALGRQLQFQRIVAAAVEKAILEITSPVVEQSVKVASQTTKELVLKDYAIESDESRIYAAARALVANLAGCLAHAQCKECLPQILSNQLRNSLQSLNIMSDSLKQTVQLITNDNLCLGCTVVERAATEKAVQCIDGYMSPSLDFRRKQREGVGSAFYNAITYMKGPFASIPEALRPKPGCLSTIQHQVYEYFVQQPWQNQSSPSSNAAHSGLTSSYCGSLSSGLTCVYGASSGQQISSIYSAEPVIPGFSAVAQPLDLIPEEMDPLSAQPFSASALIGMADGVIQHGAEMNSPAPSFPSMATAPELQPVESSIAVKDSGTVVLPLPIVLVSQHLGSGLSDPLLTTGDALDKFQLVARKLEALITKGARDVEIQGVIAEVPGVILKCVFRSLYENASNSVHVTSHVAILVAIRNICKLIVKELTSWVIYSDEERKFNKDITVRLIRSELLNLAEYNVHLAKLIDGGRNKAATDFSVSLVQTLVVQEPQISVSKLYSLMDTLEKLASRPGSAESLQQLVEIAKNSSSTVVSLPGSDIGNEDMIRQSRDKKVGSGHSLASREDHDVTKSVAVDPAGFLDQVSHLFAEWCRICELPGMNDASYAHYISQLQQSGLLKGDDITDRFFCILTELSVTRCLFSEVTNLYVLSLQSPQQAHDLSFIAIDMYSKLVVLVLKYCAVDQGSIKVILLAKILSVIVRVIQKDALENKSSFNPRLYFRLFVNWLSDFGSPDTVLDGANFQVLTAFADAFHALQPLKVPGWRFAWLELVSHRSFMPQLLMSNSHKGWPFIHRLLIDLFKFMEPYVRNDELGETVRFLYKGTLRVLLLLLHDFPEFLCGYYFSFCDVIPPSCIQMRNIILCAFPHNMELPYPLTPNLKVDLVPESSQSPCILSEVDGAIKAMQIKTKIDEYLKSWKKGSPLLAELNQSLLLPQSEAALAGTRYNVPLINSLVLYLGMQAIYTTPVDDFSVSPTMDIFQVMITDLDPEGRYLFLNSVANQLRYPSSHTFYFSLVLLYLFSEASQDVIQEQIMRVLLERLIVKQPHPWGLLATFIKLVKNPQNDFWNQPFIRHERKIVDELFELLARPYGSMMTMDGGMVPGGVSDNAH